MSPVLVALLSTALATEGMWLPEQAPAIAEQFPELKVDPAALADPLGDPLGSIVSLGGCSASFVSADGLIATNHHCVEGYLQFLSTGEHNHHRDGFLAPTLGDELHAGPTARLRVVEDIRDVTAAVLAGVGKGTVDRARRDAMDHNIKKLVAACEATPDRRCQVSSYFGGSTWRLIRTFEIEDVRVVWAPPMGLGQFGGEVDNWMWPRHGADGALIRAYVAKDGSAAPYAPDNVPYHPPHHLVVDPTGIDAGDFVMVAGFPGSTERHQLASELRWQAETALPEAIERSRLVLDVLHRHMDASPEARARLGAMESGVANGFKNSQGMLEGLRHTDILGARAAAEAAVLAWAAADPRRGRAVKAAYDELEQRIATEQADADRLRRLSEVMRASSLLGIAHDALRWADERAHPDLRREQGYQDRDLDRRQARYRRVQQSLWLPAERELVTLALERYASSPPERHVATLDAWLAAQGGVTAAVAALYDAPTLEAVGARLALLDQDAAALRASTDPFVRLAVALEGFLGPHREAKKAVEGAFDRLRPIWGKAELDAAAAAGRALADDANGTLRLTFGHVQGYAPRDGLLATPFTTLKGMAAKATPGVEPFDAPAAVLARVPEGPSSRFAHPRLGDVPVDFLADLDITGGNSGSAVLDAEGRLVGLAFDGNWESIASDWLYLPDVNRCIAVDVRYLLWLLSLDPASRRLLDELGVN